MQSGDHAYCSVADSEVDATPSKRAALPGTSDVVADVPIWAVPEYFTGYG